jgi:hypothetical protein
MSDGKRAGIGRHWIIVILASALAACGGDAEPEEAAVEGAVEGVSSEEMVGQASPMSLEEAESLGIVDTTVSVGAPVGPDSLPDLGSPPPQ